MTNPIEPSAERVEAGAKALEQRWSLWALPEETKQSAYRENARAVLLAADAAAPQAAQADHLELFKAAGEWAAVMNRKITPDVVELLGWLTDAANAWAEKVEAQATQSDQQSRYCPECKARGKAAQAQAEAVPADCDVRKIMIDHVPGEDGMGLEVYAKSVADVENLLSEMGQRIEELECTRTTHPAPQAQELTDKQCDAIYSALDEWAREFDACEFGLPASCGGGSEGGRQIIRGAIAAQGGAHHG